MSQTKKRIEYLDLLRILATFAVILLHVAASNWQAVPLDSYAWKIFNLADSFVRWSVPIFVMISGALFLDPDRTVHIRSLFKKNILRMVIAYLFWSAVYAAGGLLGGGSLKGAVLAFVQGHYHLWFLLMIILLYAMVPLLRRITASRRATEYFLVLSIGVTYLLPGIFHLLGCLRLPHTTDLLASMKTAFDFFRASMGFGYLPYFVLGHYLAKYEIGSLWRKIFYLLGLWGMIGTMLLTDWYSNVQGVAYQGFYSYFDINVGLAAAGIFLFFKYVVGKRPLKGRMGKLVFHLSDCSFGIFLVHAFVIKVLEAYLGLNTLAFDPILSVLSISVLTALISYGISALLHRIPWVSKYIL